MTARVFINGEAGTTGLHIRQRLEARRDVELIHIDPARRKDADARAEALNAADAVILCLPDDAAREAVSLVSSNATRIINASTAHRTAQGWVYGFPEMAAGQREAVAGAARVSNPGCYATGMIALVRPLTDVGLIPRDWPLTVNAVSGYSGGGRTLIEEFEREPVPEGAHDVFRPYGLTLAHKHVPEMQTHGGLSHPPLFAPSVGRFAQGMIVEVPLPLWAMPGEPKAVQLHEVLSDAYAGERFVEVVSREETAELQKRRAGAAGYCAALDPEALNGANRMRLFVFANEERRQVRLLALLDNLGKGASGAAVQNLNLVLGLDETAGLA